MLRNVIVLADSNSNCLRIVTLAGVVTTLAGNINNGYTVGIGVTASFNYSYSVAAAPATGTIV